MLRPAIVLRDPDLIKDVLTTNFNSFRNNDANISKRFDPLSATNPFFNEDDEWRDGRKTISPMFSQSKVSKNAKIKFIQIKILLLLLLLLLDEKYFASDE